MSKNLINPYDFYGINIHKDFSKQDVKNIYHELAQLTHPDKGGNKEDFIIVHQAYQFILRQTENIKEMVELDILEKEFNDFCKNNPIDKFPSLLDIRDDIALFNKKFNENWENKYKNDLFKEGGYGELMEKHSNYQDDINELNNIELKNKFTMEIVKYKEPKNINDITYGDYKRFDVNKINNYNNIQNNIYDYKESFTEIIPKKDFKIIKDEPFTKNKMNKDLDDLIKERNSLLNNL